MAKNMVRIRARGGQAAIAALIGMAMAICVGCREADRCCAAHDFELDDAPLNPSNGPGIALSFDDAFIDEWYDVSLLLDGYGAVATFFVVRFDKLGADELDKLRDMEARGHEIGCHSFRHEPSGRYDRKHGVQAWLDDDILPAIDAMEAEGFRPLTFSFPHGEYTDATGEAALEYFQHIRGSHFIGPLPSVKSQDKVFIPAQELPRRPFSCSFAIDKRYGITEQRLKGAMERALENNEVLAMYGHQPLEEPKEGLETSYELLEHVLDYATDRSMTFYLYRDFAQTGDEG